LNDTEGDLGPGSGPIRAETSGEEHMGAIRAERWRILRDRVKERWGALTDEELDRFTGRVDRLAELIEERYGEARERVDAEIRSLLIEDTGTTRSKRGRRQRNRGGGQPIDADRPPTSG
jgi:uncharacterized protein YjbJ (UPF0337 family)